ncbi:MAG: hypothetical protein WBO17_00565 [Sphingorhabdus sp.]
MDSELLPPVRLAIAYAPAHLRSAFGLLLRFDDRLAGIVGHSTEPLMGQIKMAWWRDAIEMNADRRPKNEPLLVEIGSLADIDISDSLQALLTAWERLLIEDDWTEQTLCTFAAERAEAIFGTYSKWIDLPHDMSALGAGWARGDLRTRFGDRANVPPQITVAVGRHRPQARPLAILARSVEETSGLKLLWHAVTGL